MGGGDVEREPVRLDHRTGPAVGDREKARELLSEASTSTARLACPSTWRWRRSYWQGRRATCSWEPSP